MNFITQISRFIVGILFILSGLIKLNDPVGFSFKLEEYFSEAVFNMTFLQPFALSMALIIVILEVILGVFLLLGIFKRFTISFLFLMIVFFTFLTFYSAYFNKVTDCGCFGDAIKLTPWESFYKDVILLVLILVLIAGQKHIKPLFKSEKNNLLIALITIISCIGLGYYVVNHLPIIDFRAYKTGTDIKKGMEIPANAPKDSIEIKFTYLVNGVEKTFGMNELTNLPSDAVFVNREDKLIKKGYEPPIKDFKIERDGADYTDEYLEAPKVLVFVAYDLEKSSVKGLEKLNDIAKNAIAKNYKVIALTASSLDVISNKNDKYKFVFDFYFCDGTALKTIERANPSLIVLEYGKIKQKLHWQDYKNLNLK